MCILYQFIHNAISTRSYSAYSRDMATPAMSATGNQGEMVSEWVNAPADSHVLRYRLMDRSASEFGASSEVWVTFKGGEGRTHKPPATYRYKFGIHADARAVFDALCGAAHPGSIVHEMLKKPRVPYEGPF